MKDDGRTVTIKTDDGRTIELAKDSKWMRPGTGTPPVTPAAGSPGSLRAGSRVDVDVIYANYVENASWRPGTIVKDDGKQFTIRMDDGATVELAKDSKWVRAGSTQAPLPGNPPRRLLQLKRSRKLRPLLANQRRKGGALLRTVFTYSRRLEVGTRALEASASWSFAAASIGWPGKRRAGG